MDTSALKDEDRAQAEDGGPARQKIAYFAGDATNPTVRLRIRSFIKQGAEVVGFTFRRDKFHRDFVPFWENVPLGQTTDRNYLRRLLSNMVGFFRIIANRKQLSDTDIMYARLFDAAFLAMLVRGLLRPSARLVYEIEDVQAVFFRKTIVGRIFRFLERRILANADLVVVPSPGFVDGYLEPFQTYDGPVFLLENRIQLDEVPSGSEHRPKAVKWKEIQDRWVIGWFGTLRCEKSMRYLEEIAERMGEKVLIYTRGHPTETGLERYLEIVNRHPNWIYEGEYTMPEDLEELYGQVHFTWCMDFLDEGGNSNLLLACRMYHGGYFGSVPIMTKESRMADHLKPYGIGHTVGGHIPDEVCDLLQEISWEDYVNERDRTLALRDELFLEDGSSTAALLTQLSQE